MKFGKMLLSLLLILALCGCGEPVSDEISENPENPENEEISEKAENEDTAAEYGNVKEYRLPRAAEWFIGKDSFDKLYEYIDNDESVIYGMDSRYGSNPVVDDGDLLILADDDQKNNIIQNNLKLMEQGVAKIKTMAEENMVEWSDDFSSITYTVDESTIWGDLDNFEAAARKSTQFVWMNQLLLINRVLYSCDCNAAIRIIYKNVNSGHIVTSGIFPYEGITMSYDDWKKSSTEDVLRSSAFEEDADLRMAVKEISPEKIIFTPIDNEQFYKDDESLCLCRGSVYDEVIVPHDLAAGDVVILRLNGLYAVHDDGDDIPDIAPKALIPERYIDVGK